MADPVKILVTGANGQLEKELKKLAPSFPQYDFLFLSRTDLPIHHYEMVRDYFKVHKPGGIKSCVLFLAESSTEKCLP